MDTSNILHCQNCGCVIGQMEMPQVFRGTTVCLPCYQRLSVGESTIVGQPERQHAFRAGRVWTVHDRGNQYGPHTEQELATMLAVGTLSLEALVWREGSPRWIPLTNIVPVPPVPIDSVVAYAEPVPAEYEPPPTDLDYLAEAAHRTSAPSRRRRRSNPVGVVTIEQTAKVWKLQIVLANLLMLAGVAMTALWFSGQASSDVAEIGGAALVIGFVWHAITRSCIWWFHG